MKRSVARLAAIFSLFVFGSSATLSAPEGKAITIGGWSLQKYIDDESRQFSHCAVAAKYRDGTVLIFSINRNFAWRMALFNEEWQLTKGTNYSISYQVDAGTVLQADALVVADHTVAFELVDSETLFQLFKSGHLLKIGASGKTLYFQLTDSSKALEMTRACTQYSLAATRSNPSNPFENSTTKPATKPEDAIALTAEAATVSANLLSQAGIQNFQMLEDIPLELKDFHSVWTAPGAVGGLMIDIKSTVEEAKIFVIAASTSACKGRFGTASQPSAVDGVVGIKVVCETAGAAVSSIFVLVSRAKGGTYVMRIESAVPAESNVDNNAPQSLAAKLTDASYSLIDHQRQ